LENPLGENYNNRF